MSLQKQVTRAAGVIGFATIITRTLGFLRDMVIALKFGAGLEADAYFVAFRIPSMLRRLVGEGALTAAFIPVFVEERQQSPERAWQLANTVITLLCIILALITFLGMVFTPYIVKIIAPGFDKVPEKFALTTTLTRITFPYIFFISLAALAMGILNSLQHFFSSALAPMMLNISLISCALFLSPHLETPVTGLAIGVLIGGITQLLFQIPALRKREFRYRISVDWKNPAVQKVGLLLLPAFFGLAVNQISVFANTLLASYLSEGSVSYLFYSYRLTEFPLGIFGMAISTAILPTMSAQSAQGDYGSLVETLSFALRLVLFITIPSMVGLIVLRVPIVTLLFERGYFTRQDTLATAQAVLYYTIGLSAIAGGRIIVPVFYSLKDTATPVKCAAASVGLNILFSLLLMGPLQHNGLALATTLSSFVNFFLLLWFLRKRLGQIGWRNIAVSAGKVAFAALLMGLCCIPLVNTALPAAVVVLVDVIIGIAVFLISTWLLKVEELFFLQKLIKQRLTRM